MFKRIIWPVMHTPLYHGLNPFREGERERNRNKGVLVFRKKLTLTFCLWKKTQRFYKRSTVYRHNLKRSERGENFYCI